MQCFITPSFISICYYCKYNNEIYFGWWIRYLHANGASWFFFVVYIHIFKGIYMAHLLFLDNVMTFWCSYMIFNDATAFLGYVLPWGQMSFGVPWLLLVVRCHTISRPRYSFFIMRRLFHRWVTLHRFYSLHFTYLLLF